MNDYLLVVFVGVLVLVLLFATCYCQHLDEKHKKKALCRARKIFSHDKVKSLENKLEGMLPLEIRQLNRLSDTEFHKKVEFLLR